MTEPEGAELTAFEDLDILEDTADETDAADEVIEDAEEKEETFTEEEDESTPTFVKTRPLGRVQRCVFNPVTGYPAFTQSSKLSIT
jgi:hypothetical protein